MPGNLMQRARVLGLVRSEVEAGRPFPGVNVIATATGIDRKHVSICLQILAENGDIECVGTETRNRIVYYPRYALPRKASP